MCAIFGVLRLSPGPIDRSAVKSAAMLMQHRGPDAFGQWGIPCRIEFAHLRLAIIDLSPGGNQPFLSSCGRYIVVFNGEIYNYVELREKLQTLGHHFRTQGDTEVLLMAYIAWGTNCVARFNGDWGFALYDRQEDVLFCSRDRFGVKPFNYAVINDQFIFSSEIKSILHYCPGLRQPNYNIIANFCRNSLGSQCEDTWFAGIKRLLPAHNLIWSRGVPRYERYWDYPTTADSRVLQDDACSAYRALFTDAVKIRMRSDVPVGTTLSSGIDSGSIVSALRTFHSGKHHTFTAIANTNDFKKAETQQYRGDIRIDEQVLVQKLAGQLGLDAHYVRTDPAAFVRKLSRIVYHLESGNSSPAILPLYSLLQAARKEVTVVLEGQGADELLGGYVSNTFPVLIRELLARGNLGQAAREFVAFRSAYSTSYMLKLLVRLLNQGWIERLYYAATGMGRVFGPALRDYVRVLEHPAVGPRFSEKFNHRLWQSHTGGLVNLLHYGDAISMAHSVESRLPFMDFRLVECVFKLSFGLKVRDGLGKYIHRQAMRGVVPDYILWNRLKFGFSTPLAMHFASPDSPAVQLLRSKCCRERGILTAGALDRLLARQFSGSADHSTFLFRLLSVELWFRNFIDTLSDACSGDSASGSESCRANVP
jgi:asparagine synthase (glutamine-hydrolysing)